MIKTILCYSTYLTIYSVILKISFCVISFLIMSSAPVPVFPTLAGPEWKQFQGDFFETFLPSVFTWLRGTKGMSIAKNTSAAFYRNIVFLPSLFDYLLDLAETDKRCSFLLVR